MNSILSCARRVYHLLLVLFSVRGWFVGVAWDVVCPKVLSPEDGNYYESKLFENLEQARMHTHKNIHGA